MTVPKRRLTAQDFFGVDLKPTHMNFICEYVKDFDPRRAAVASGFEPETGYGLLRRVDVQEALVHVLQGKLEVAMIDNEWLLLELVDNHLLARAQGKLSQSNTALNLIGKHAKVDAFAAEKVIVAGDKEVMERLQRARDRKNKNTAPVENVPSFL